MRKNSKKKNTLQYCCAMKVEGILTSGGILYLTSGSWLLDIFSKVMIMMMFV